MVLTVGSILKDSYHLKKCILIDNYTKKRSKALLYKEPNVKSWYIFNNYLSGAYCLGGRKIFKEQYGFSNCWRLSYNYLRSEIWELLGGYEILIEEQEDFEIWY